MVGSDRGARRDHLLHCSACADDGGGGPAIRSGQRLRACRTGHGVVRARRRESGFCLRGAGCDRDGFGPPDRPPLATGEHGCDAGADGDLSDRRRRPGEHAARRHPPLRRGCCLRGADRGGGSGVAAAARRTVPASCGRVDLAGRGDHGGHNDQHLPAGAGRGWRLARRAATPAPGVPRRADHRAGVAAVGGSHPRSGGDFGVTPQYDRQERPAV